MTEVSIINKLGKLFDSRKYVCLGLVIMTLIVAFMSPLNPLGNGISNRDSSAFRYVGIMMKDGFVPYKDTVDNKGIFFYFIQYLGALISERYGIWIIEVLFLFATFFLSYKVARRFCGRSKSLAVLIFIYSLLGFFYHGGNLTEVYALPFMLLALIIFIDYFKKDKISKARLILCGLSCASVFLIRINMMAVWMIFPLMVLIKCISQKDFLKIVYFLCFFLVGFVVILAPSIFYLMRNNALDDFILFYLKLNFARISDTTSRRDEATAFYNLINYFQIGIAFSILAWNILKNKGGRFFDIGYFIYLGLEVLLVSLTGEVGHNSMAILPALLYPVSAIANEINIPKITENKLAMILALFIIVFPCCTNIAGVIFYGLFAFSPSRYSEYSEIQDYIDENTTEDEQIIVHGFDDVIYILSGRKAASRYSYQFGGLFGTQQRDDYFDDLSVNLPAIILVDSTRDLWKDEILSFIDDHGYGLDTRIVSYDIYKLKDD